MESEEERVDLDALLRVLGNPVRRELIRKLSQEPNYSFKLSRDLGLAQQQVSRHLTLMGDLGVVSSYTEESSIGPERKIYSLDRSLSVIIDIGPNLYRENVVLFDQEPGEKEISKGPMSLMKRMSDVVDSSGDQDKLSALGEIIGEIDTEIENLENRRGVLLHLRDSVMREASRIFQQMEESLAREIIHFAFDEQERNVSEISKSLDMREDTVSSMIRKIRKKLSTEYV